ncbi:MAG TPA: filamentous hemagglutinin N-terminal domain-containing protein, partial [Dyella sp.]|uniref:two-partner secretion domain-containing protein n=1 Tax=Dyella sp. TaxID=1869338 RepID=UPI002D79C54A
MNKQYRLVWNKARRIVQVASELAHRPEGGTASSTRAGATSAHLTLSPKGLSFAAWIALGMVSVIAPVSAGQVTGLITADPNAPGNQRPTVLGSPGNAALINITTPSKAGVSINQYSAFQVDSTGAVLNNSRTNTQTTLAGTIGGNPWLANGSARVIVNQVNSSAPAALGGYIEVAGDKAQVVIASPSGIAVDGGGFLNASRVTLTTGTPVVSGGALEGYRVSGDGVIQVSGNGLDASRADYTDIIARAAVLDGTIYAQQLQLTLGANQVSVDQSQITPIAGTTQGGLGGAVPAFALDSSALGGMYANKIVLLANEHGVGVRNAGTIAASTGEVVVTTDGRLENSGRLQSQSDTTVLAAAGISNSGTISATNTLSITTPQDVDNSQSTLNAGRIAVDAASLRNQGGTIAQTGLQGMSLQAGALSNRNGGSIGTTRGGSPMAEAGDSGDGSSSPSGSTPPPSTESGASGGGNTAPSDGSNSGATPVAPLADGILHIAGLLDNDGGRISAAAGFDLTTANGLTNDGGQLGLRQLTVTGGDLSNRGGMLTIDGPAIIHGDNVLNDAGTLNVADALTINVQNLSNRGGTITHSDVDATTLSVANTWDNTDGTLASNAASLTVNSSLFINDGGHLNHAGTDGLTLTIGTWRGASGTVATAGATTVQAGSIDHRGASLSATQIHLTAANVNNEGGTIVASGDQANTLTVSGALDNSNDGTIASNADLAIQADTLGNVNGTIQHAGDGTLRIDASTLSGSGGAIQSNGALLLTGNTINLRGGTTSAQAITIDTGALTTAGGNLAALGSGLLQIHARGLLDNTDGRIGTNGGLQLVADTVTNTNGGIQTAGADATTVAITHAFTNANGQLATVGSTTLRAGSVDNTGGTIAAGSSDALTLTVDGLLTNDAGNLLGNSNLALTAGTLSNHGGTIQAQQAIDATVAGTLDNSQGGAIIANGNLDVQAATLLNANTLVTDPDAAPQGLHGQHVTLQVSSLDNTAGAIQASNGLAITGGALTNAGGVLDGQGDVTISGTSLDNSGHGQVIQHGDTGWLSINLTQALGNTAKGLIGAKGTASLHAGAIDNSGGTIYAGNDLTLASDGTLNNTNSGLLQTNGNLAVSAVTTLDNSAGHIDASGAATITAAAITNTDGQMLAGTTPGGLDTAITDAALTVTATGAIANQGGMIGNRGSDVILQAASVDNSSGGTVVAQRDLTLDNVASFNNTGGTTYATRDLSFQNPNAILDNTGGQFGAGDTATLNLAAITNSSGGHMQANTLALTTPTLTNDGGTVKGALVQATFGTLNGIGQIYGAQELDAHVTGDYTHLAGQRLESDGVLSLIVDGTLTNQGTLQTPGELDLMAASLINTNGAVINASADDGSGVANIHVSGSVDNQQGATLEGDTLNVSATTLTNTGNIVGDVVTVDANTLTNGRDLGTTQGGPAATAAVDYGEGFIGASQALNLHVASLANLDAQLYSSGDLSIAADAAG